jgi:transposase InsO family protein
MNNDSFAIELDHGDIMLECFQIQTRYGGKFIGQGFQQVLECKHIKDIPTTVKNPQANAICERMNQTV